MRKFPKISITEIENSYLNFFTPAVILVAYFYLFNFLGWLTIASLTGFSDDINFQIGTLMYIIVYSLLIIINWFIFIPKLKVIDIDGKKFAFSGLKPLLPILVFLIFFSRLIIEIFINLKLEFDWSMLMVEIPNDPISCILWFTFYLIIYPFSFELFYRRTVIPLLEDRGCKSIWAVVLTSLGYGLTNIGSIILIDFSYNLFSFFIFVIIGFFAGFLFILKRNIIYSFLLIVSYKLFIVLVIFGQLFSIFPSLSPLIVNLFNILDVLILLLALIFIILIVYKLKNQYSTEKWITIIKEPNESVISKGVIGFFIITILLNLITATVTLIGRLVTNNYPTATNLENYFLFIIWFYLIAFLIPFILLITTEYARS